MFSLSPVVSLVGRDMPKRKENSFLEQIEAVKKKKVEDIAVIEEENNFEFVAATSEELLRKILSKATASDILAEYLYFLKVVPPLLNNHLSDLLNVVQTELDINQIVGKIGTKLNFKGDQFPILDALSFKLGTNLRHILAPPTTTCLFCSKTLIGNNKPTQVALHTPGGPQMATKYAWECRNCSGVHLFGGRLPVFRCFKLASIEFSNLHFCQIVSFFGIIFSQES